MRTRVSAAFAAGGRPGPRLAVCGTLQLCHSASSEPGDANFSTDSNCLSDHAQLIQWPERVTGRCGISALGGMAPNLPAL